MDIINTMFPVATDVLCSMCGSSIAFRFAQAFPALTLSAERQRSEKRRSGKSELNGAEPSRSEKTGRVCVCNTFPAVPYFAPFSAVGAGAECHEDRCATEWSFEKISPFGGIRASVHSAQH